MLAPQTYGLADAQAVAIHHQHEQVIAHAVAPAACCSKQPLDLTLVEEVLDFVQSALSSLKSGHRRRSLLEAVLAKAAAATINHAWHSRTTVRNVGTRGPGGESPTGGALLPSASNRHHCSPGRRHQVRVRQCEAGLLHPGLTSRGLSVPPSEDFPFRFTGTYRPSCSGT
jgi:hypothetical protein